MDFLFKPQLLMQQCCPQKLKLGGGVNPQSQGTIISSMRTIQGFSKCIVAAINQEGRLKHMQKVF